MHVPGATSIVFGCHPVPCRRDPRVWCWPAEYGRICYGTLTCAGCCRSLLRSRLSAWGPCGIPTGGATEKPPLPPPPGGPAPPSRVIPVSAYGVYCLQCLHLCHVGWVWAARHVLRHFDCPVRRTRGVNLPRFVPMQGAVLEPDSHAALGAAIRADTSPRANAGPRPARQPGPGRQPDRPQPGVILLCRRLLSRPFQGRLQLMTRSQHHGSVQANVSSRMLIGTRPLAALSIPPAF